MRKPRLFRATLRITRTPAVLHDPYGNPYLGYQRHGTVNIHGHDIPVTLRRHDADGDPITVAYRHGKAWRH